MASTWTGMRAVRRIGGPRAVRAARIARVAPAVVGPKARISMQATCEPSGQKLNKVGE